MSEAASKDDDDGNDDEVKHLFKVELWSLASGNSKVNLAAVRSGQHRYVNVTYFMPFFSHPY